jgi:phosphatidylglycerol lysyltransferase
MDIPPKRTFLKSVFLTLRRKSVLQGIMATALIGLCLYFVRSQGSELRQAMARITHSPWQWAVLSGLISLAYIVLSSGMYVAGFAAAGSRVSLSSTLLLFLRRNVLSVILPAGGISSLAFFNRTLAQQAVTTPQHYIASAVYTVASYVSLILLAFPVLLLLRGNLMEGALAALGTLLAVIIGGVVLWKAWQRQHRVFRVLNRYVPFVNQVLNQLQEPTLQLRNVGWAILLSIGVELCGIAHLWLAFQAIHYPASVEIAIFGYVIATLLYAVSPFMRGIGIVEISLTYALIQYDIPKVPAVSITLYYRFFEFWLPLMMGVGTFLFRKDNLLLRVFPAFLVLLLGLVNLVSALTPAIDQRLVLLGQFLSVNAMELSKYTVMGIGVVLVFLSLYLIRGLQNAWWLTVLLVVFSIIGHLTKAIDYEEALFGCLVLAILLYTRPNYTLQSDRWLFRNAIVYLALAGGLIYLYGLGGLWVLKTSGFKFGMATEQLNQLLMGQKNPPLFQTGLARGFDISLQLLELLWLTGLAYLFVRPVWSGDQVSEQDRPSASDLLHQYGHSSLDYFKVYPDKQFFFNDEENGFLAYRKTGQYAVVLEGPVAPDKLIGRDIIRHFELYCQQQGLKTLYYRVDETDLPIYESLGKKNIFIGQEGIISLASFSLEGSERKSLRNGLRKLNQTGHIAKVHTPPLKEGLLQKLRAVSDEWLRMSGKQEAGFTQGVFNTDELKQQVVITLEDGEEKVIAFANLIPDYAPGEGTYDLIRKIVDAPSGALDAVLVEMITYFKAQNKQYLNLGMAPLSGIDSPQNLPEVGLKFAYDHLKPLAHYKGLRFFKEKYADRWINKYLVYGQDLDLLQAAQALAKVSHYQSEKT